MNELNLKQQAIKTIDFQKDKRYLHIDYPLNETVKKALLMRWLDPKLVAKHRWLPFIQYNIKMQKYDGHIVHIKLRKITLPSHTDGWLFKFYAEMLNVKYEDYLTDHHLQSVPIGYRKHHSSLLGAKEVIDFISQQPSCWIIKGDFKNFFDNLRHQLLRDQLSKVLYGQSQPLPADWYNVITGLERYRFVSRHKISALKTDGVHGSYFKNFHEYNQAVRTKQLHVSHPNRLGIPQGTAISGALANTYMIDFDEQADQLAASYKGIYRRYSDDFIVVVPKQKADFKQVERFKQQLIALAQTQLHLEIEAAKTKTLRYENQQIYQGNSQRPTQLNYLGISFSGKKVTLIDKSFYREYYRGKRQMFYLGLYSNALRAAQQGYGPQWLAQVPSKYHQAAAMALQHIERDGINNVPHRRSITTRYLPIRPVHRKNFLDYAMKAQRIFTANQNSIAYQVTILHDARRIIAHEGRYLHYIKETLKWYN